MDRVNLNKISGGAHEGLEEWTKMLGCLGFRKEGVLRQESFRNGKPSDCIIFGLLAEDYQRLISERKGLYLFESPGMLYRSALSNLRDK